MFLTKAPKIKDYVLVVTVVWLSWSTHRVLTAVPYCQTRHEGTPQRVEWNYTEKQRNLLGKILIDYVVLERKAYFRV